jgi:hypothetical protein
MANKHVGLTSKEFGEMRNVVFTLERNVKNLHSWVKEGGDPTAEEHIKEISHKTHQLAHEYLQKHVDKKHGNYTSLDDSMLVGHLHDVIHLVNTWHSVGSSHDHSPFNHAYVTHENKYGHATSTIQKFNVWYKNPRYKHHKNKKRKPKNKDKPAGLGAPSADQGGHVAPVIHHSQQESRLTGLLEKLKM